MEAVVYSDSTVETRRMTGRRMLSLSARAGRPRSNVRVSALSFPAPYNCSGLSEHLVGQA